MHQGFLYPSQLVWGWNGLGVDRIVGGSFSLKSVFMGPEGKIEIL